MFYSFWHTFHNLLLQYPLTFKVRFLESLEYSLCEHHDALINDVMTENNDVKQNEFP